MSRRNHPAPRQSRAEAAAETHELLLASAREVFIERGYHGASIYEIAERAGRTIGSLYSHFGGKEGVFLALIDRHFDDQLKRYSRELSEVESEGAALEAGADFWTRFLEQDPELVVLFIEFWSHAVRDPKLRRRFAVSYRKVRSQLARLIDNQRRVHGIERGPSATDAAIVFDALIDGFALHRLIDPEGVPGPLLTRALRWLAHGMIAEGKATGT